MPRLASPVDRFREAMALHRAGAVEQAEEIYRDLLRENPEHAGAWHLLGVVLHSRRDLRGALEHIEKALSVCDFKAVYWNNFGAVLKDLGRLTEAKAAFERALSIRDAYPDAWSNLGLIQTELGDLQQAEKSIRYALRLDPGHGDALVHLAAICRERLEYDEALRLCADAAAVAPGRPKPYEMKGSILKSLKRFDEASEAYQKALSCDPKAADSYISLGLAVADLDDCSRASTLFRRAAELRPERSMWRLRHLSVCPIVFQAEEEITEYRADLEQQLDAALADPPSFNWQNALVDGFAPSFQLAHHGVCNRQLKEKYARLFAAHFPKGKPKFKARRKIRVGFLCTAGHEGGYFRGYGGIMSRLDRSRFEVVGLVSSAIAEKCRHGVPSNDIRWIGFPHSLPEAYAVIRGAECDIVAHRHVGTDTMNYFLPFLPLAPVQTIGSGMHGTTGITNVDFGVSSQLFERGEDAAEDYSETLVQFEGINSWQRRPQLDGKRSRSELGLPPSGAIYFCPQRLAKILPGFDGILEGILESDPSGHIVLLDGHHRHVAEKLCLRFRRRLGQRLAGRILCLQALPPGDYYHLLSLADVVLDTPNYSTSYTGYDALGLGIPIVTMPGKFLVQRYALGLYQYMGIPDLVTSSEREYIALAVRLGTEPDFLRETRRRIRERSEVLFEDERVIREYEELFMRGVDNTCQ